MGQVVIKLGKDISTDDIYPGRFMATVLPSETPQFCFFNRTEFNARLKSGSVAPGSVVLADENFGCGSSREQAASAMKGFDLIVVAKSVARIFLQNAINVGARVVLCPGIEGSEGDELEVTDTEVLNKTTGKAYPIVALPPARQAIIDAGGLIPYTRKKLMEA